jgi:hypothetical protein
VHRADLTALRAIRSNGFGYLTVLSANEGKGGMPLGWRDSGSSILPTKLSVRPIPRRLLAIIRYAATLLLPAPAVRGSHHIRAAAMMGVRPNKAKAGLKE